MKRQHPKPEMALPISLALHQKLCHAVCQNHFETIHCRVEGGRLILDGKLTTPSQFANALGGSRRNAWDAVWIMLPAGPTWQRAGDLRPPRRAAPRRASRARTVAGDRRAPGRPPGN